MVVRQRGVVEGVVAGVIAGVVAGVVSITSRATVEFLRHRIRNAFEKKELFTKLRRRKL